jgi:UDP-glucose 4-epimerase
MKNVVITGTEFFWGKRLLQNLIIDDCIQSILALDTKRPNIQSEKLTSARMSYKPPFHFEWADSLERSKADTLFLCPFSVDYCYHDNHASHLSGVQNSLRILRKALELQIPNIVVLSSFLIYGARWENPAYIIEDHLLLGDRNYQHIRGLIELEEACLAAIASSPSRSNITILRIVNAMGPNVQNSLSRYLDYPIIPTCLGFDPPLQLIYEDDVINAMIWAANHPKTGAFNIAADGYLTLKEICAMLNKQTVPIFHGLMRIAGSGLWKSRLSEFSPAFLSMLRYRLILDLTRSREVLKFQPEWHIRNVVMSNSSSLSPCAALPKSLS